MFFFLAVFSALAFAQTDDLRIFNTCHRQFTRHPAGFSQELLDQVKQGRLGGPEACLHLLGRFRVTKEGDLQPAGDRSSLAVLNTFHDLHASCFSKNDFVYFSNDCLLDSLRELYDVTAPALYFDFALLDDQKDISYAVTSRDGLFPLRSVKENKSAYFANRQELLSFGSGLSVFGRKFFGFEGLLEGIAKEGPDVRMKRAMPVKGQKAGERNVSLYRSLGPGFMGNPSYLLRSSLPSPGIPAKRGAPYLIMAKQLMHDLLCIDVPSLGPEDVSSEVDTKSELSFKHSASCMSCHSTIYPLAITFRNLALLGSGDQCVKGKEQSVITLFRFPERKPAGGESVAFHELAGEGKLYFRDFEGRLVSIPHSSLGEMAKNVAAHPQFYYCSAKRYFTFLTGLDPAVPSERQTAAAAFLRKITYEYMEHRKPKKLIETVLRSEFY